MRYKIVIFFLCAALPHLAQAADTAPRELWNFTGKYIVAWSGITIGRIYLTAVEDAEGYRMTVDTKTHGIATAFSQERRIAEVSGIKVNGRHIPAQFESRPQGKDLGDFSRLTYDAQGNLVTRTRQPEDDPAWRPRVPRTQENTATDPITAGFRVREALSTSLAAGRTANTYTYDGARLAEMRVRVINPATKLRIMGRTVEALELAIARIPVAGYTPKELKKFAAGDPDIRLYFTADSTRMPLRITVDAPVGQLSATLEELK